MSHIQAPSLRELAPKATEGVNITVFKKQVTEHSFHHFVVPLPLGGRHNKNIKSARQQGAMFLAEKSQYYKFAPQQTK